MREALLALAWSLHSALRRSHLWLGRVAVNSGNEDVLLAVLRIASVNARMGHAAFRLILWLRGGDADISASLMKRAGHTKRAET